MPFKPNYRMQRADRKRAQAEKQQKKLERRAKRATERKAEEDPIGPEATSSSDDERGV